MQNPSLSVRIEGPFFEKGKFCESILRSLPIWFGIEEAIVNYVTEIDQLPTFLALDNERVIGFISLKEHTRYAAEVLVMGILEEVHRQGIGRALMEKSQNWLQSRGIEYLQVKTLGPSDGDENFAKTRAFYENMGFRQLEEIKTIWDEHNPCVIMVKKL